MIDLVIRQGDSTDFNNNQILFNLKTDPSLDLTDWKAIFQLENFKYTWDDITSSPLYLVISNNDSYNIPIGQFMAAFKIIDDQGRTRTIRDDINVVVQDQKVDNPNAAS